MSINTISSTLARLLTSMKTASLMRDIADHDDMDVLFNGLNNRFGAGCKDYSFYWNGNGACMEQYRASSTGDGSFGYLYGDTTGGGRGHPYY